MKTQNIIELQQHLNTLDEAHQAEALKAALADVFDEGVDFAGDCLRAGCSLTEAAAANPYRCKT